jgi:ligand-binding sensor domain-containing protein
LVRYRDGRFTRFTSSDGLADGGIFNLCLDSSGRLWVPTTRGGACRIDHPEAERPTIVTYTTADGLSSNDVKAVTEDRWGRIYLGTGRGIDRLDPATGRIRHYTVNEGALLGDVNAALQDRDGALWFSYGTGLVRGAGENDDQEISCLHPCLPHASL